MPPNQAAYQPFKKAPSLLVKEAPYPTLTSASDGANQIVVRNGAVAVNPIDWLIQSRGDIMFTHLKYPDVVLGHDLAGEVVEVGPSVTRFRVGDRVVGFARGPEKTVNSSAESAFQQHTVLREEYASPLPADMTYAQAAVLPLALATAAAALFDKAQLGLQLPPTTTTARQPPNNHAVVKKTVIIWGGSTSVGCSAIQLAVAAGYEVFSTASPKNFAYLRKLGAARVWDYRSPTVTRDIVAALKEEEDRKVAGAVSIGAGAAERCMEILDGLPSDAKNINKFVAMVTFPVPEKAPQSLVFLRTAAYYVSWLVAYKTKGAMKGVRSNLVLVSAEISRRVFTEFLPTALELGLVTAAPEPRVVGHGLESVQKAFELQKQGVSAEKLVVTL
ncbi:enoyl-reductase [Diplogelasinospora grovesii]|uniref:Enoyl-reductase n=1 Tax=Diplogelasinospora grovesii TaxID=303347 RepID=A0AAN6RZ11_9PEZI|nr:enoyl-reductase [Diplogelasinospora grovesii]